MYKRNFIISLIVIIFFIVSCGGNGKLELDNLLPEGALFVTKIDNIESSLTKIDKLKNEIVPVFKQNIKDLFYNQLKVMTKEKINLDLIDKSKPVAFSMVINDIENMKDSFMYVYIPSAEPEKLLPEIKKVLEDTGKSEKSELKVYKGSKYVVIANKKEALEKIDTNTKNTVLFNEKLQKNDIYIGFDAVTLKKIGGETINTLLDSMLMFLPMQTMPSQDLKWLEEYNKKNLETSVKFIKTLIEELEYYHLGVDIKADKGILFNDHIQFNKDGEFAKFGKEQQKISSDYLKYISTNAIFSFGTNFSKSLIKKYSIKQWEMLVDIIMKETKSEYGDEIKKMLKEFVDSLEGSYAVNFKFDVKQKITIDPKTAEENINELIKDFTEKTAINFTEIIFLNDANKFKSVFRKAMKMLADSKIIETLFKEAPLIAKTDFETDVTVNGLNMDSLKLNLSFTPKLLANITNERLDEKTLDKYKNLLENLTNILTLNTCYKDNKVIFGMGTSVTNDLKSFSETNSIENSIVESTYKSIVPKNANMIGYLSLSSLGNALTNIDVKDPQYGMLSSLKKSGSPSGLLYYTSINENYINNGLFFDKEEIKYLVNAGQTIYMMTQ